MSTSIEGKQDVSKSGKSDEYVNLSGKLDDATISGKLNVTSSGKQNIRLSGNGYPGSYVVLIARNDEYIHLTGDSNGAFNYCFLASATDVLASSLIALSSKDCTPWCANINSHSDSGLTWSDLGTENRATFIGVFSGRYLRFFYI